MFRLNTWLFRLYSQNLFTSKAAFFELLPSVLDRSSLSPTDLTEIRSGFEKYLEDLPHKSLSKFCFQISQTKRRHFLSYLVPNVIKNIPFCHPNDMSWIIISYSKIENLEHDFWHMLADEYVKKIRRATKKYEFVSLQKLVQMDHDFERHKEKVKKIIENAYIDASNAGLLMSLYRFTGENEKFNNIARVCEEKINDFDINNLIIAVFHLHKEGVLGKILMEKVANRIISEEKKLTLEMFNRTIQIYTNEPLCFENMKNFINEQILIKMPIMSARELINAFNNIMKNNEYKDENICRKIYQDIAKRENLQLSTLDLSSLLHITKKIGFESEPFFKYCTKEMLGKCDGRQLAIILHSIYLTAPQQILEDLKEQILMKIHELSPKLLLNVAKDMTEKHMVDVEFLTKFQAKALEIMTNHNDPDSEKFHTQMASFLVMMKKISGNPKENEENR
jgi:hypothetical protein